MPLTVTEIPYLTRVFGAARGCSMDCPYCSTARWSHRLPCPKCRTREVHFHPERLGDPAAARKPQVIGVSFYDELFDPERTELDVLRTLAACDSAPRHQYVFLTKRPEVAERFLDHFRRRANWWLGVTVTGSSGPDVGRLDYLIDWAGRGVRTWLSLEPWFGPMPPTLAEAIWKSGFVALGCESGRAADPGWDRGWHDQALDIVMECRSAEVPPFVKQVWAGGRCSRDPAEWPEDLRVRELPPRWAVGSSEAAS